MLKVTELQAIAEARLTDAEELCRAKRFDGAVYLCGYAVELKLKARACLTLGWPEFPATPGEFGPLKSFKTHDLGVLLHLSGRETLVKTKYFPEWSKLQPWDADIRYRVPGSTLETEAENMVSAAKTLLSVI